MGRVKTGKWGPEEVEALKALAASGTPPKAAAAQLGRSLAGVYGKMSQLGLRSHDPSRWTAEEEDALRGLVAGGLRASDIGERLGRSEMAVRIRMGRLGLRSESRHRYDWPAVERMLLDGATCAEAAASQGASTKNLRSAFASRHGGASVEGWVEGRRNHAQGS